MVTQVLCWNQASPGFHTEPALRVPGVGAALASPVPSFSSAWGLVSMHLDLHPSNTHNTTPQPYVCICATTCMLNGLRTCRCTHKLARTHEHQCWCTHGTSLAISCLCTCTRCTHMWLCTHASTVGSPCALQGRVTAVLTPWSPCAAEKDGFGVPVPGQGRWLWSHHVQLREEDLAACPFAEAPHAVLGHQSGPISQ